MLMKASPRPDFFKFCRRPKMGGDIYDPTDRDELMGLGLDLDPNEDIWTSASPGVGKKAKYYQYKKGSGDLVLDPETQEPIKIKAKRKCMSYKMGDTVGKYMPLKCSRKKRGICKGTITKVHTMSISNNKCARGTLPQTG